MNLFSLALAAPLIVVSKRWPNTMHAVDLTHFIKGWKRGRGTYQSVCGLSGLRLVVVGVDNLTALQWPPRLKDLPYDRCRDCWVGTGRMRPRTNYVLAS